MKWGEQERVATSWEPQHIKAELSLHNFLQIVRSIRAMIGGKKFIVENQSSCCLHQSEEPGVAITSAIFNGKNYNIWRKTVRTALKSKNKLGFIDGTITKLKPQEGEDQSELVAWDMVNSMICSWIVHECHICIGFYECLGVILGISVLNCMIYASISSILLGFACLRRVYRF